MLDSDSNIKGNSDGAKDGIPDDREIDQYMEINI